MAILLVASAGCGTRSTGGLHEAGSDRKVHIRPASGQIDELTVLRDTDGRIVVAGVSLLPEGTRLDVTLADSTGNGLGRTQVVVEHALFQSLPLAREAPAPPPGRYTVRFEATFAPGLQSEAVMRAVGDGSRLRGEGMTRTRQGRVAYSQAFEVRL